MALNTNVTKAVNSQVETESELHFRDLVLTIRRRKWIIVAGLVLGAAAAVISFSLAPKLYSATTTIEINKTSGSSLGLDDLSGIGSQAGGSDQMTTDLLTQQAVIENSSTALRVLDRLKLLSVPPYVIPDTKSANASPLGRERGLPLDRAPHQQERVLSIFRSKLNVSLIKGTRLIGVTFTDTDPQRAATVANAVVDAYISEYTQARYEASTKASSWLTEQLSDLKARVTESQKKVNDFQKQTGLIGMVQPSTGELRGQGAGSQTSNVALERLVELNRDLTNADVSRIVKEAIYRMSETQDPDVVLGIGGTQLASSAGANSVFAPGSSELGLLQQLRQQQAGLNVQLASAQEKYGAKNPIMIQMKSQADTLQSQISTELARIRNRAKNDFDLASTAEQDLRQRVAVQEQEVSKLSNSADQLLLLQQEEISNRQLYQDLYTKLEEANVAAGVKASNITVVDAARVPATPSSPILNRTIELDSLVGLILGFVIAFARDYFDDSILTPDQIEHQTAAPILGLIPFFKAARSEQPQGVPANPQSPESSEAWLLRAPNSAIAEAYRTLRTAVLMSRADRPPKVLLIGSALSGDGKTTTCFNTAAAFALKGEKVLIIDADMRRPRLHIISNMPNNKVGLSTYLTVGTPIDEAIQTFPGLDGLHIMTAGVTPPMPSELLGSNRFKELIASLRETYDFIFIDSPPLLLVTDALVISSVVDEIILVVRSNKTTTSALRRSLTILSKPGVPFLGIVLNAADTRSSDYASYGYYGQEKGGYYVEQ